MLTHCDHEPAPLPTVRHTRAVSPDPGARQEREAAVRAATNAVVTTIDPPLPHAADGPLAGVRVGVKDNIDTAGVLTTCGSRFFADRVPDADAVVVTRLVAAGAEIVAKLNLSEFAVGVTSQNSASGPVRNPWDLTRVPGGSSGGSGAAVAAGLVDLALGTDTGGSVRLPAAACGVTGLRPGIAVVPDAGIFPMCDLVDTIGPLARTVELVARGFYVLAGRPVRDLWPTPPARIGVLVPWFDDLDPGVGAVVAAAAQVFADGGSELVPVKICGISAAQDVLYTIVYSGLADLHGERLARPELFQADTLTRLRVGCRVTEGDRVEALEARAEYQRAVDEVFEDVDVLLTPTLPVDVPRAADGDDVLATTRRLIQLTAPWSLHAGPTLALPVGRHPGSGMPVGAQLTAPIGGEDLLLDAGAWFQQRTPWHTLRPGCCVD
jgi:aspartyl-tRNA(Asn)/glutamyl-tRNA(Gln) amidotransferase subunit A